MLLKKFAKAWRVGGRRDGGGGGQTRRASLLDGPLWEEWRRRVAAGGSIVSETCMPCVCTPLHLLRLTPLSSSVHVLRVLQVLHALFP